MHVLCLCDCLVLVSCCLLFWWDFNLITESQFTLQKKSQVCFQMSFVVTATREAACCECACGPAAAYPTQFENGFQPFCRLSKLISVPMGNPWLELTPETCLAFLFSTPTVACFSGEKRERNVLFWVDLHHLAGTWWELWGVRWLWAYFPKDRRRTRWGRVSAVGLACTSAVLIFLKKVTSVS